MHNFAAFGIRFNDALSLLPQNEKMEFMASLIGSLSVHVNDEIAFRCMERALDDAQGFNQPRLQLVQGGKRWTLKQMVQVLIDKGHGREWAEETAVNDFNQLNTYVPADQWRLQCSVCRRHYSDIEMRYHYHPCE